MTAPHTPPARTSVYDHAVDPQAKNNSHAMMLRMIGSQRRVLEVGCATGGMTRALLAQNCSVVGVELNPEAAAQARQFAEAVHVVDLDAESLAERLVGQCFEVIVFGDVLEHLRDPQRCLSKALPLLAPGGRVVISVPNMAHGDVRLALLEGQVPYAELGLLDRTHRHWFTRDNLAELLRSCGLKPTLWERTVRKLTKTEIPFNRRAVPWGLRLWLSQQPEATTYQFVVQAQRETDPAAAIHLPKGDARWGWLHLLILPFV